MKSVKHDKEEDASVWCHGRTAPALSGDLSRWDNMATYAPPFPRPVAIFSFLPVSLRPTQSPCNQTEAIQHLSSSQALQTWSLEHTVAADGQGVSVKCERPEPHPSDFFPLAKIGCS